MISLSNWARNHFPTRETMERNRWVRPFAHLVLRPDLWRFNRRSVPRGVALGCLIGVAIPVAHSPIAALLAVFVAANVPVAFVTTWAVSNPFTWPLLWWLAWRIGKFMMHADGAVGMAAPAVEAAGRHHHGFGRLADAGAAFASGLFVEAIVLAAVGYLLTSFAWRFKVGRERRRRLAQARLRHALAGA